MRVGGRIFVDTCHCSHTCHTLRSSQPTWFSKLNAPQHLILSAQEEAALSSQFTIPGPSSQWTSASHPLRHRHGLIHRSRLRHRLRGNLEVHRGSTNGPDVLLHSIVSMMSAIVMLVLACSLRVQAQPRRRAHVANAYPVMLAYGMVPTSEMTIAVSDDVGEVGIPISVGQRIDLIMQPIAPVVDAQESFEESPVAPERVPNPTEHERRQEG